MLAAENLGKLRPYAMLTGWILTGSPPALGVSFLLVPGTDPRAFALP